MGVRANSKKMACFGVEESVGIVNGVMLSYVLAWLNSSCGQQAETRPSLAHSRPRAISILLRRARGSEIPVVETMEENAENQTYVP